MCIAVPPPQHKNTLLHRTLAPFRTSIPVLFVTGSILLFLILYYWALPKNFWLIIPFLLSIAVLLKQMPEFTTGTPLYYPTFGFIFWAYFYSFLFLILSQYHIKGLFLSLAIILFISASLFYINTVYQLLFWTINSGMRKKYLYALLSLLPFSLVVKLFF